MRILVSRSEFARRAGISPGAVTKACKKNLAPATVGKRIDFNHPAAVSYINNRAGSVTTNGWTAHNEAKKQAALEKLQGENYADMTLREVIKKYGTDPAFSDWLKCIKLIEDINEKRLKNECTINEMVSRQLIKAGIVAPFEAVSNKLLTDGAKTMASRVTMMVDGGRSVAECEAAIVDQLSSFIKMMKSESLKRLQNV